MHVRVIRRDLLSTSLMVRFNSWNPAIRSASLLVVLVGCTGCEGLDIRSPRLVPNAESLELMKWAVDAHREFLRMVEVTERISECRTCFVETLRVMDVVDEVII